MTKRSLPTILFPLLVALVLIAAPKRLSVALQNGLAEHSLVLRRWIGKASTQRPSAPSALFVWQDMRTSYKAKALKAASTLAPFWVTSDYRESQYLLAEVVYRTPSRWNSSLWINKGSLDSPLLAKNSPVLSGDSVVGVIDYVGKNASSVRLITDSGLTPSVRVARGAYDRMHAFALHLFQSAIVDGELPFETPEEKTALLLTLQRLIREKNIPQEPEFLAKGILHGSGDSLWKAQNILLKGVGFNYDFKDQHGPARDLRTGEPIDPEHEFEHAHQSPIVQVGDLLVTSGMDGVFPQGLKVARVVSIAPLTEGAFTYDLYAAPTAEDLLDLEQVIILPPLGFDANALPSPLDRILHQIQ